jgi:hypothetical protein
MTDDALDPRDELASAHLDGATTPDEAAQVAGDEDLEARVAAFAASREAVRAVGGPVDEARREAAIAAALDAFEGAPAGVVPITARRRGLPQRWLPAVGMAAAALVLALLIPLLTRDDGSDEDTVAGPERTTTLAPFAAGSGGGAAEDSARSELAAPGESGAAIAAAPPALAADLGPHADLGSLADAARATLASPPTTVPGTPAPTAEPGAEACLAGLRVAAADAGGTIVLEATAVLDDRPVVAAATRQPDGTLVLDVVALDGCAPIASVDL